jgi:gp16 family phage-associated protein
MVTRQQQQKTLHSEALLRLREAGISIPQWAKANGFSTSTVKAVLYGHSKGLRGEAHRVAVALGIKAGVVVEAKGFTPVRRTKVKLTAVSYRT